MEKHAVVYPAGGLRICVDSYQNGRMEGRVYSPLSTGPICFYDYNELLLQTDRMFDRAGYPQGYQVKRQFTGEADKVAFNIKPKIMLRAEEIIGQCGKTATFDIVIRTRQHSSWQGGLYNRRTKKYEVFDGDLQLLYCLERCLNMTLEKNEAKNATVTAM